MKLQSIMILFVVSVLGLILLLHASAECSEESSFSALALSDEITTQDTYFEIYRPAHSDIVSEQIVRKTAYIASYNKDTKIPNWVAWHLTADHTDGPYGRLGNFHEEESVASPRATLDDYRGSGWSRGHLCPAGDNKWDETAMYESFSLVNVCPQNAALNSGLWNRLEIDCRRWARRFGDIYIVCGPVFLNREHEKIGTNEVFVPEAFFKVILCLQGTPKAIGFVVRNNEGKKKRDQFINTVDDVERITGYDFFPALPDSIEDAVEAHANMEDWR
jgi:endonuclease G